MEHVKASSIYPDEEYSRTMSEAELDDLRRNHFVVKRKPKAIKGIFLDLNINEEYGKRIFGDKFKI